MADDQIGRRIRERLLARGYKRDDGEPDVKNFAFDYRFDKGHLYAWLGGKMKPFKDLKKLCDALHCSADWLLFGAEYDPKEQPGKARRPAKPKNLLLVLIAASGALLSPNDLGVKDASGATLQPPSYRKRWAAA